MEMEVRETDRQTDRQTNRVTDRKKDEERGGRANPSLGVQAYYWAKFFSKNCTKCIPVG